MNNEDRLKNAILAIKKLNKRLDDSTQPIAIIGMSCKFPGADNIEEFWELLKEGRDGIIDVPSERWSNDEYYSENPKDPGKIITNKAGFINDVDKFDASFFSITPKDAEYLDPQHRLLLEQTWLALESAAISLDTLSKSSTGVFIGMMTNDYAALINDHCDISEVNAHMAMGSIYSTASGRISYLFNLNGPNFVVDTACSSSLVALHEACKSLQRGESDLAIVGGVNLILNPRFSVLLSKAGMLSPEGYCKTFDEKADGYARGEGCGILILKRLADAQTDGDNILSVIKASGVNHGGSGSGLTVPNGEAQERLLKKVLAASKLEPDDIDYIECHGTGTKLGDPIEVDAIKEAYGINRKHNLKLGSVKSNIGHLEGAAGVASVIKTVLALQHSEIPKNLHFNVLNSHIDLSFPSEIITQNTSWESSGKTRRAAVSSFGVSGTNAHIILEEPVIELDVNEKPHFEKYLFVLSAKKKESLVKMMASYISYLKETKEDLANICYTSSVGRSHFIYRIALLVKDKTDLLEQLASSKNKIVEIKPIDKKLASSDLEQIASMYLEGQSIDWFFFYKPYLSYLTKVHLPTYCFDKKSYWLKNKKKNKADLAPISYEVLGSKYPKIQGEWISLLNSTPPEFQRKVLSDKIKMLIAEQLGMDSISELGSEREFTEIGIDSVSSGELGIKLSEKLNLDIKFSLLWKYNTVSSLVEYILEQFNGEKNKVLGASEGSNDENSFILLSEDQINKYGILMGSSKLFLKDEKVGFNKVAIDRKDAVGWIQVLNYVNQGENEGSEWMWNLSLYSARMALHELFNIYIRNTLDDNLIEGFILEEFDIHLVRAIHHKKDIILSFEVVETIINDNKLYIKVQFDFSDKSIFGEANFVLFLNEPLNNIDFKSVLSLRESQIKKYSETLHMDLFDDIQFSYGDIKVKQGELRAVVNKKIPTDDFYSSMMLNSNSSILFLVELMYLYAGWDNRDIKYVNREIFGVSSYEKINFNIPVSTIDNVTISVKERVESYERILYEYEIFINDFFIMNYVATIKYFDKLEIFNDKL